MSQTTVSDAIDALKTKRHARAALGLAAAAIRRGYDVVEQIRPETALGGLFQAGGVFGGIGDADVRQQARDLLDRANAYAGGLYATIADTDDPIDEGTRARVGVALDTARSDLALIETVASALVETFLSDLEDLIGAIEQATVASTKFLADAARKIVDSVVPEWVWWVLGGAAVVGVGVYAFGLSKRGPV